MKSCRQFFECIRCKLYLLPSPREEQLFTNRIRKCLFPTRQFKGSNERWHYGEIQWIGLRSSSSAFFSRLVPNDYFLFSNVTKWLGGKRFGPTWLITQTNSYFEDLPKSYYLEREKKRETLDEVYGTQRRLLWLCQTLFEEWRKICVFNMQIIHPNEFKNLLYNSCNENKFL